MTEAERLGPLTVRAAGRFLEEAADGRLLRFSSRADFDNVARWIMEVKHTVSPRFRKFRTYAYAHYESQTVTYNPIAMQHQSDEDLFDTVLHEMGHLFCGKFVSRRVGHGIEWQSLGWIVGYAPVGCTTEQKRERYMEVVEGARSHHARRF